MRPAATIATATVDSKRGRVRPASPGRRRTNIPAAATDPDGDGAKQRQIRVARPPGGSGREIGEPAEPLQPQRWCVARVECQAAAVDEHDSQRVKAVNTSEIAARTLVTRRVANVQAAAAGMANSGSTGAKNRAGGLEPPHHMAKWVTVTR